MRVLVACFKHLQLFCFAFTLAAGSMLLVGMSTGKFERSDAYVSLSETMANTIERAFPGALDYYLGGMGADATVIDARSGQAIAASPPISADLQPTIRAAQSAQSSLQELRARQFTPLIPTQ